MIHRLVNPIFFTLTLALNVMRNVEINAEKRDLPKKKNLRAEKANKIV